MTRLRRVDCCRPGLRRVRHARGFRYLDKEDEPIGDREVIERIRGLAIPPAWEEVWICQSRQWVDVRSDEINEYLKGAAGGEFTAKDFRTWNATVLAAVALAAEDGQPASAAARKRAATTAVGQVAEYLSNTPAVCRRSYIDPRTFDHFDSGKTIHAALERIIDRSDPSEFPDRERIERAVLKLLG